jgi:hypothetical protein
MTRVLDLTIRHERPDSQFDIWIDRRGRGGYVVKCVNNWRQTNDVYRAKTYHQAVLIALASGGITVREVRDVDVPLYVHEVDNLFAARERRSWWRRFWKRMRR